MKTQLYFDLAGNTDHPKIHFRESKEVKEIMEGAIFRSKVL